MRKIALLLSLVLLGSFTLSAQNQRVSGRVTGPDGSPLIGATVIVSGTSIATVTGGDGQYSINAPSSGSLDVSLLGMEPQQVAISGRTTINVQLQADAQAIDEVIVVAYGTTTRESFTGSASTVTAATIANRQLSNISKALEGSVPGVQTAMQSGQPGESAKIRIRGIGSINSNAEPLYVVDGVPYGGDINAINPADVASMTVLKDAASTALYGSRAANGVIMVTTKKGNAYNTQVSFQGRVGVNSRGVSAYDVMKDPGEYLTTYWRVLANSLEGGAEAASAELISRLGYNPYMTENNLVVNTNGDLTSAPLRYRDDWIKDAIRTGIRQEYNVTVSGGSERSSHFLSAGYLNDEGILNNSNFERFSVRSSVDYKVTDFIKLDGNVSYTRGEQNSQYSDTNNLTAFSNTFMTSQNIAPIYPIYAYDASGNKLYNENGDVIYDFGDGEFGGTRVYAANSNVIAMDKANQNQRLNDNASARFAATISFLKNFQFQANLGYDLSNRQRNTFQTPSFGDAKTFRGRAYKYRTREQTLTANQLLTYNRTFGSHSLDVLVGHETYKMLFDEVYGVKTGFFEPATPQFDNAITMEGLQSWGKEHSIESYFGRVNYDYANKYYFSASLRRDGSSRFAKQNRWGTFWSLSGSWRLSQENFVSSATWIDDLRLRASYGVVGNESIWYPDTTNENYYADRTQYRVENSDGAFAVSKYYQGNPDLTWETSNNVNIGLSASLFSFLSLDVEYYHKNTVDMLYNVPQPPSSGIKFISENALTMTNSGLEFTLNVDVPLRGGFRWDWTFTGSTYKNKITGLPEDKRENGITADTYYNYREGRSRYDFYYYKSAGVDPATGEALWYRDVDGERVTTNDYSVASKYYLGSGIPDFSGGISTSFGWKGIDLSIDTNYQLGGLVNDEVYTTLMHAGNRAGNNWHKDILKAWTPTNTNSNVPILDGDQNANQFSDRFLIDASYFNIRNITLGYTFPESWLKSAGISSTRLYVSADNLALFSKRKGLDPRQYIGGRSSYNYSTIRTVSLGLSLNF